MTETKDAIHALKKDLRVEARARRDQLAAQSDQAGLRAAHNFLAIITPNADQSIALYLPITSELDTIPLLNGLWNRGNRCALPRVAAQDMPLIFHHYQTEDTLANSTFGIPEPLPSAPTLKPEIVVVPLLAFDKRGFRLGYGGGFYDRTLANLRRHKRTLAIGYGFAGQEVPEVPCESHDEPLDMIVTDQSAFRLER